MGLKRRILNFERKLNQPTIYPHFLIIYTLVLVMTYFLNLFLFLILFIIPLAVRFSLLKYLLREKKERADIKHPVIDEMHSYLSELGYKFNIKVIDNTSPNVTTSLISKSKVLFVTSGLLDVFSKGLEERDIAQIRAIIGHEIVHLKDIRFIGEAVLAIIAFPKVLEFLLNFLNINDFYFGYSFTYLTFLMIYLAFFWIFRRREYRADSGSIKLGNKLDAFRDALIRTDPSFKENMSFSEKLDEFFDTHPRTVNRIKRLKKIG